MSDAKNVASIYDARSEQYDVNQVHVKQAQDFVEWANLKSGQSVLDLACGTGHVALGAKQVVGTSGHVIGVDISEGMLKVASRKAKAADLDVTLIKNDITDLSGLDLLPAGSEGFDVITCASALVLLQDPLQAVKHWKSLLRTNGCLITDVLTTDANAVMTIFAAIAPELGESVPWDAQRWQSKAVLEQLMIDAGLHVDKIFETKAYATTHMDRDMGSKLFHEAIENSMYKNFGKEAIREKANTLFLRKFAEITGETGSIDEETRYWVVIAIKRE
ncbi:hypothetical protein LTR93_011396 [Exophiala xenobiotica]|nr:hypothetical protein LTR93_011396 [Exophiala xenobiotica]